MPGFLNRRSFFFRSSLAGALAAIPGVPRLAARVAASSSDSAEVYTRLGLRPIINASGTYTHLGGSLMPAEVIDAMNDAAKHYVPIRDLTAAVGDRIAKLTGKEVLEKARHAASLRPRRSEAEMAVGFGMDNPIDEWAPGGDGLLRQYTPRSGR